MKKLLALLLALAMVFALAACGNNNAQSSNPSDSGSDKGGLDNQQSQGSLEDTANIDNTYVKDEMILGWASATSLTPWGTRNNTPGNYEVYEMLYECDAKGEMYPLLADATYEGSYMAGCDHEPGSGVYTVKIYDYIKDHAGNPVTASDVAYSFMYQYENENTSGWNDLINVEATDDTTVVFTFKEDQDGVGELLNIFCRCFIVSEAAHKASPSQFANDMCGTGPYKFVDYVSGSSVTLEKNEDYWQTNDELRRQEQQANVQKIVYQFIDETAQRVIALKTGTVDFVHEMSADGCTDFLDGGEYADQYNVYSYQAKFVNYLDPNCGEDSIMSDVNMRLAVFNAIDLDGLVTALGGTASRLYSYATGYYTDFDWVDWASKDNYNTRTGVDPTVVKGYLDAAGYNNETLILVTTNNGNMGDVAAIIAAQLMAQGINVETKVLDNSSANALIAESDGWDLSLGMMAGDQNVTVWAHDFSWGNTADGDRTINFIRDQEWEDLLNLCCTEAGHTPENMEKWWDHATENAYTMGLFTSNVYEVLPEDMTYYVLGDKLMPLTGASTYAAPEA
ncbi:MAG: ABC transporter substrate-binding protein [Oscillospiraceae bacterium]